MEPNVDSIILAMQEDKFTVLQTSLSFRKELDSRIVGTGTCKYGSTVENHHPKYSQAHNLKDSKDESSSVLLNILGLPMCQDGKSGPYYMRTGSCKYGCACKFHHPQPTSTANTLPVVGTRAYGLCGSAVLSSANAPYVGKLSAAALSKATYLYSSLLHLHQSCVPVRIAKLEYLCVSGSRSHGTKLNLSFQLILA